MNPKCKDYPKYNTLGMYSVWVHDFTSFYNELGPRPSKEHSVDRIDTLKGYFPGNIRWATPKEQACNTTRNIYVEGEVLSDYAKRVGIPYNTIRDRYHKSKR